MSEKKELSDHLADAHGVWLTRSEYKRMSIDDLERLHAEQALSPSEERIARTALGSAGKPDSHE